MSLFVWQSNKAILFYFIQNTVTKIPFSTGAKRPSFQNQESEQIRAEHTSQGNFAWRTMEEKFDLSLGAEGTGRKLIYHIMSQNGINHANTCTLGLPFF